MPRSKNAVASRARRKKVLNQAKGFYGKRKNVYTVAKNVLEKGLTYSYVGRKLKKREYRSLWIARINAAVREEGLTYKSSLDGEEAAEEAFHLTNAPEDYLDEDQKRLLKRLEFKGPSLSVGDVVRVEPIVRTSLPEYFLCKSFN